MSEQLCDRLDEFADGELAERDAAMFRDHLAGCAECERALLAVMQLAAVAHDLHEAQPKPAPVVSLSWYRRQRTVVAASVALAAAAALLLMLRRPGRDLDSVQPVVLAQAPTRSLEARITHPGADAYRPYDTVRSGTGSSGEQVSLEQLASLEKAGDLAGVAAGYLLRGDWDQAAEVLDRVEAGPDLWCDRALVELANDRPGEALLLLDSVLKQQPKHPQALWNRGLALRELGLRLVAAESFEAVAALEEPGWAQEAGRRAAALRAQVEARRTATEQVWVIRVEVATGARVAPQEVASLQLGWSRLMFYDLVRSASTKQQVEALAPLARSLDERYGKEVLQQYLERIASADFSVRGPLARTYARAVAGEQLAEQERASFLDDARRAQQEDLLLGAMLLLSPQAGSVPAEQLPEYRVLAESSGDLWFQLLAMEQTVAALVANHQFPEAEAELLQALEVCARRPLAFRCGRLEATTGDVYVQLGRWAEAERHLAAARASAERQQDSSLQWDTLWQLALIPAHRDDVAGSALALTRAYLRETVLRIPDDCGIHNFADEALAHLYVAQLRFADARTQLEAGLAQASGCEPAAMNLSRAFVLAQVLAVDGSEPEVAALQAELELLRASEQLLVAEIARLDHIQGRLILRVDVEQGRRLLRRAIAAGAEVPAWELDGRRARAYSYSVLALDHARRGEYAEALALIAEESATDSPTRCALGVALEASVTTIAMGPDGTVIGQYHQLEQPGFEPAQLVPAKQLELLEGCDEVAVYARAPVFGSAGLLPATVAWSYRLGSGGARAVPAAGRRLVVSDVTPPVGLGLPNLQPHSPIGTAPGVQHLQGAAATPSNVLGAMRGASEIEIHAHGLVDASMEDASFVALSPEADGRFALTARAVAAAQLREAPVVYLAACQAAEAASYFHESWSLASAFMRGGASAVIASTQPIPDAEAEQVFGAIRARMAAGDSAAEALRAVRSQWSNASSSSSWVQQLIAFE